MKHGRFTNLRSVDLPAPRKPVMIVSGTFLLRSAGSVLMSVLYAGICSIHIPCRNDRERVLYVRNIFVVGHGDDGMSQEVAQAE